MTEQEAYQIAEIALRDPWVLRAVQMWLRKELNAHRLIASLGRALDRAEIFLATQDPNPPKGQYD